MVLSLSILIYFLDTFSCRVNLNCSPRLANPQATHGLAQLSTSASTYTATAHLLNARPLAKSSQKYSPCSPRVFLSCWMYDMLLILCCRYSNFHKVHLVPLKKDIAFVKYLDEESCLGVAKDALHNYKLDGENQIKVCSLYAFKTHLTIFLQITLTQK